MFPNSELFYYLGKNKCDFRPPGIGKTTCAHLIAELEGWEAIEFNASDTRSKKSIEVLIF